MDERTVDTRKKRLSKALLSHVWRLNGKFIPDLPDADCKGRTDISWDFELDEEGQLDRGRRHDRAIDVCLGCPERKGCLIWALDNNVYGVWGARVLVPPGKSYLRCKVCYKNMIRSRVQTPPVDFVNTGRGMVCKNCIAQEDQT